MGLPTDETKLQFIRSCYHTGQSINPKDGIVVPNNEIITCSSTTGSNRSWKVVQVGPKSQNQVCATLESDGPPHNYICYNFEEKKVKLQKTTRDVWVLKEDAEDDNKYTIELGSPDDPNVPMYLTFKGDGVEVTVEQKVTDPKQVDTQFWKFRT